MSKQYKLIEEIYKDASMGEFSTQKLLENLKGKDNKIIGDVERLFKEYSFYKEKAKDSMAARDILLNDESGISKMMSSMGIFKEVLADNSDSAIADLLIQGLFMGEIEMQKRIDKASDDIDKEDLKLAKDFLKFQRKAKKMISEYL